MTDNAITTIAETYNKMKSDRGEDVDSMTAKMLLELKELQSRDSLSNRQIREYSEKSVRALLYGGKPMTGAQRSVIKKVLAKLLAIFSDK